MELGIQWNIQWNWGRVPAKGPIRRHVYVYKWSILGMVIASAIKFASIAGQMIQWFLILYSNVLLAAINYLLHENYVYSMRVYIIGGL